MQANKGFSDKEFELGDDEVTIARCTDFVTSAAKFRLIFLALYIPFKLHAICTLREWYRELVKEQPTITENNNVVYREATDGS